MKTTHIVLDNGIKTKTVQVDLVPENDSDSQLLNSPNRQQFDDHFALYLEGQFPNYSLTRTFDSDGFPRRLIVEIVRSTGI